MRVLLTIVLLACVASVANAAQYVVHPPAAWVERVPVNYSSAFPRQDVRWGVYALLDDHQSFRGTVDYYRHVRAVLSPAGVDNASEIAFDFDPAYQHLVIHDIAIVRGSRRINALDSASIRVIDKEDDANERIYDGMLSAVAFLNDVRPGDILDYSWSIEGANPLLGGRFADTFDLTSAVPTKILRHRLLWPTARPLRYQSTIAGITPVTHRLPSGDSELIWERRDVAPLDVEDQIPDWFNPYEHISLTDFASWQEVVSWSNALFRQTDASTAAVRDLAARIRREHSEPNAQIVAAIRFVQDDIRYLGIEMGRNSHEPHQPSEVLEQRWGDCKDKALLLASLLRELGVDAAPALVSTKLRHKLDDELPSPMLFDHVITMVRSGGRTYWIDATLADQGGTLQTIETPNDERALVVDASTRALTKIDTIQNGSTTIDQTYATTAWDQPTSLVVRATYTGRDADNMRANLASISLADLAKDEINRHALDHPRISAVGLPKIADDRDRNIITVAERYWIRDLWTSRGWTWRARTIEDHLQRPETMIRSMPLAFDHPLHLIEQTRVEVPERIAIESGHNVIHDRAFQYESSIAEQGRSILIRCSLESRADGVTVADAAAHLANISEIRDGSGVVLKRTRPRALLASAATTQRGVFAAVSIIVLAFAVMVSRRSKTPSS